MSYYNIITGITSLGTNTINSVGIKLNWWEQKHVNDLESGLLTTKVQCTMGVICFREKTESNAC